METGFVPQTPDGRLARKHALARAFALVMSAGILAFLVLTAKPPEPTRASSTYTLVKTYPNPVVAPNQEFGNAVALLPNGNQIVVAARSQTVTVGTTGQFGAAYILSTITGTVDQRLTRGGPAASNYFGFSLAVSGNQVLAGAPYDNVGASATQDGAAYLFNAQTGSSVMTFTDPAEANNDHFGWSVGVLSSTAVLVGVPQYSNPSAFVGRAYICQIADGTCPTAINSPTGSSVGYFGYSVAALGDKFAVGAPLDGNYGTVYIFTTNTGAPFQTIQPPPISTTLGAAFGWSLAAVNGNILIGAQNDGNTPAGAGSALLYRPDGALLRAFHSPNPETGAHFGAAVASDGTFILIGAPGAAGGDGRAYLFDAISGALMETFKENVSALGDNFGSSVAVLGENFLVGAPGDHPGGVGGAAYRFGVPPPGTQLWLPLIERH